jgi:uncharacterized membrane protein
MAVASVGLLEAAGAIPLPMALTALRARLPVVFPLHMGASALALLLLVPVLLARRRPAWHRWLGRAALVAVAVGGVSALPTALTSDAFPLARAGFLVQAVLWLAFAVVGFRHVRAGQIGAHRAAMARMAAVTAGAVVLRLLLAAVSIAGLDVHAAYGWIAWAAWLLPLATVEIGMRLRAGRSATSADRCKQPRGTLC